MLQQQQKPLMENILQQGISPHNNEKAVGSLVRINADGTLDETFKNDIKFEIVNHKTIKEIELQQIVMLPNGQFMLQVVSIV